MSVDIVDGGESCVKCLLIVETLSSRCVNHCDTDMNDSLVKHITRIISNNQIVVCDLSLIGSKCIMLTLQKCKDNAITLPVFELD